MRAKLSAGSSLADERPRYEICPTR
jgi:hypothetical protein